MSDVSSEQLEFHARFFLPRYWPTWALFAVLYLVSWLPRSAIMKLGAWLGTLYRRSNSKRERIVQANLAFCFPELTSEQRETIAAKHFSLFGASVLDYGTIWWASKKRLSGLICFKNQQHYSQAIEQGNVLILLPHFLALDAGGLFCSQLNPSMCMMKTQKNELLSYQLWKGRARFKPTQIILREQGLRPYLKSLRAGIACYYLADEDFGSSASTVFAPLFGQQASTLTTVAKLAKLGRAQVLGVTPRLNDDGRYEVEFSKPLAGFPSGDDLNDATATNALLEHAVRQSPEQYLWTFQWFKTRPKGQASIYS